MESPHPLNNLGYCPLLTGVQDRLNPHHFSIYMFLMRLVSLHYLTRWGRRFRFWQKIDLSPIEVEIEIVNFTGKGNVWMIP